GHHFSPESLTVRILNDTSGVVFEDITRDTLRGLVAAGLCRYSLGQATLRVIDESGHFDTLITTSSTGHFLNRIPALKYNISIDGLASGDQDAQYYFGSHQEQASLIEQDSATLADTTVFPAGHDHKFVELLYRTKPAMTITGMPLAGQCTYTVVRQGKR